MVQPNADDAESHASSNAGGDVGAVVRPDLSTVDRWHLSGPGLESVEAGAHVVIDLRFGDPTVEVDTAPAVRSRSDKIPPVVDAQSVIRRHFGDRTRLAAVVTRATARSTSLSTRMKRVFDVTAAGALVVVLLPVWAIAALAIRLTSPGPVFYRQLRHGKDGRQFGILKFRSMVDGADSMVEEMEALAARGEVEKVDEVVFKSFDDPRVTRIGHLLRRTNLDETPQLLNVIAGSMSLVGPRPLVTAEIEALSDRVREIRHSVTPGITCLWQVVRRDDTTFAERMALDLLYVQKQSPRLDSYLLTLTPGSIVKGVRSY